MFFAYLCLAFCYDNGGTPNAKAGAVAAIVCEPVSPKQRLADLGLSVGVAVNFDTIAFVGAQVDAVKAGSPSARAGLKVRDVIIEANGRSLGDTGEVEKILAEALRGRASKVSVFCP